MEVGTFAPTFGIRLDALSLTMLGVITGVGFFIHLFAAWYMREDDGFARFFSYMNLFVAAMLFLVLADDLLFLYFGWEGVGLCSYLLIGFWYKDPANDAAARKAFVVTRIGDTSMIIGLFVLYREFGSLNIDVVLHSATAAWTLGNPVATLACLLLLGGAVGKSAQLPLQTWLADAMAGPTPVSALIHAATMVTAGVYLVARMHPLFDLSPVAMQCVGAVGAITLLLAGFAALLQTDIKKILAYSTMSQIGYMFLAEGAGAYGSAIFHLMTHAFFKALLFLAAGSVILAMHHEQDVFRMGGLRTRLPFTFIVMLIGALALVAFPFTSGYYSKDQILHLAYQTGHHDLWLAGLFGAFLTSLYTFRLIFVVFFGPERWRAAGHGEPHAGHGSSHQIPLAVLAVLAVIGGFIHPPLAAVLPAPAVVDEGSQWIEYVPVIASFAGIALAWLLFLQMPQLPASLVTNPATAWLASLWKNAWGFDWVYDRLFVRPFVWLSSITRNDPIDGAMNLVPATLSGLNVLASATQNGNLRWYAAVAGAGLCVLIAVVAFT
jgi:NADH-quinone oxidoreductase subunit L